MKKWIMVGLSGLFVAGGLLALTTMIDTKPTASRYNNQTHADWPKYNFSRLINDKTDLVAHVTVAKAEKRKGQDGLDRQFSTLTVNKVFWGQVQPSEIVLNQAVEYVNPGETYIMFLKKNGDYYYEADGNAKLKEINGRFKSKIPDFTGEFTLNEFAAQFAQKVTQSKK